METEKDRHRRPLAQQSPQIFRTDHLETGPLFQRNRSSSSPDDFTDDQRFIELPAGLGGVDRVQCEQRSLSNPGLDFSAKRMYPIRLPRLWSAQGPEFVQVG